MKSENLIQMKGPVEFKSSWLKSAEYSDGEMTVQFQNGSKAKYPGILPEEFEALCNAGSKGEYFNAHFKGRKYTLLGTDGKEKDKSVVVATPEYLALIRFRKLRKDNPHVRFRYGLWAACGKEKDGKPVFRKCMSLLEQAADGSTVGWEHLDAAIQLAKERA